MRPVAAVRRIRRHRAVKSHCVFWWRWATAKLCGRRLAAAETAAVHLRRRGGGRLVRGRGGAAGIAAHIFAATLATLII